MASIATCPQCAKQMAMPEEASLADRVQCPTCEATFAVADAQGQPLPVARILEIDKTPPADVTPPQEAPSLDLLTVDIPRVSLGTGTAEDKTVSVDSGPPADVPEVTALSSWESRLKNAIEADATDLTQAEETDETITEEQPSGGESDFEFHLDPPDVREPLETAHEIADLQPPEAKSGLFQAKLETVPRRRSSGSSFRKLTTAVVGAGVVGSLLGLYALLWLKGPSGDYLGLAQYLPDSLLPATATATEGVDSAIESTPSEETQTLPTATDPPARQLPPATEPESTRLDTEVRAATAEQPMAAVPPPASISPEAFSGLVAAAREAAPELVEGTLATNESVARMGNSYMAFCRLAEHFDFVHHPGLAAKTQAEVKFAKEIFRSVAAGATTKGDLATIASRWWGYNARPSQGIFLVGRIQEIQPVGARTLCFVAIGDSAVGLIVPVLLDRAPESSGDRIAVVGSILQDPINTLPDFAFEMPQIVVAQYSFQTQP